VVPVGAFPFLIEPGVLPFTLLHQTELFTEDVYECVCRRL
jgi:hypothetical protein